MPYYFYILKQTEMNEQQFSHYLQNIGACNDAKEWALGKSWREVYDTCHRGDWLLWLYRKSKGYDLQKLTLAYVYYLDGRSSRNISNSSASDNVDYTAVAADTAARAAADAAADVDVAVAAKKENQQKTADIVREVLPFHIWEL